VGNTAAKQGTFETMAAQAVEVASAIRAYALVTADRELEAAATLSRSDLVRSRDTQVGDLVQGIITLGRNHSEALADYGITPAILDELEAELTRWRDLVARPRDIIAARSATTAELALAFDQIDDTLDILDRLTPILARTAPTYPPAYQAARVIVDNVGGRGSTDEPS
jgi:hypothetical protein